MGTIGVSEDDDFDDLEKTSTEAETDEEAEVEEDASKETETKKEPNLGDLPAEIQTLIKNQRKENRELQRQIKRLNEKPSEDAESVEAVETKWKSRFVSVAATAALTAAGGKNPAKLLRLLDTSDLEVDDEGNVDGLEDQVEDLRDEFPELFGEAAKQETKKPVRKVDAANKSTSTKQMSATERQLARIKG